MIKIAIAGACGRMGRLVAAEVIRHPQAQLAGVLEQEGHPDVGKNYGALLGQPDIMQPVSADLAAVVREAEVLVDFTSPEATLLHAREMARCGKPLVAGATGLEPGQQAELRELGKKCPLLYTANLSLGVNVLLHLVGQVAAALGHGYDMEIIEAHHNQKKDAPSGTALALAEALARGRQHQVKDVAVYGRQGPAASRKANEIGIHAVRGGDIVGEHTVLFAGPGETIEIKHTATQRQVFAVGAVRAALWLADQKPGFYSMRDVLGLK